MNLLAFERPEQWAECLADTSFVKHSRPKKWPTVMNHTMIKHAYTSWQPDAPYVILLNQYKHRDARDDEWVKTFKGKRLCVIDGGDKARYWKPFIDVADIYIKDNSYTPTDRPSVRIGCYCPSMKVPFLIQKYHVQWQEERKTDMAFMGDMHKCRDKLVATWKAFCRKHHLKGKFGDEHTYGRGRYLEKMSKTKMCLSFKGYGARARREWEAMLCGGMLVQDKRLKGYPFVIMKPDAHFSWEPRWDAAIAKNGYDLARRCWMRAPSIDIRMAALYLFCGYGQIWDYLGVVTAEVESGLG